MTARAILLGAVVALALVEQRADACSCGDPIARISHHPHAVLPPDPTLYLFVPLRTWDRGPLAPVEATQYGRALAVTERTVLDADTHRVIELKLGGTRPGPLEVRYLRDQREPALYLIGAPPPATVPQLRRAAYSSYGLHCGDSHAFELELTGSAAAAYRLQWRDRHGAQRQAYIPAVPASDARGAPRPDHEVLIGAAGCDVHWVDPAAFDTYTDVVLSMLGYAGEEIVVARGDLYLGERSGDLPRFVEPAPERAPVIAQAPARSSTWASWAAAGIAIGIVLGASAMSIDLWRRNRLIAARDTARAPPASA